jgi:hypothetical protein
MVEQVLPWTVQRQQPVTAFAHSVGLDPGRPGTAAAFYQTLVVLAESSADGAAGLGPVTLSRLGERWDGGRELLRRHAVAKVAADVRQWQARLLQLVQHRRVLLTEQQTVVDGYRWWQRRLTRRGAYQRDTATLAAVRTEVHRARLDGWVRCERWLGVLRAGLAAEVEPVARTQALLAAGLGDAYHWHLAATLTALGRGREPLGIVDPELAAWHQRQGRAAHNPLSEPVGPAQPFQPPRRTAVRPALVADPRPLRPRPRRR